MTPGEMSDMYDGFDESLYDFGGLRACKYCRTGNLMWVPHPTTGLYRLADADTLVIHDCRSRGNECKYCGETGLTWVHTDTGWRLFKEKDKHTCQDYKKNPKLDRKDDKE